MGRLFGAPLLGSLVTYTHAACPCFFFGGFQKRHGIVLSPDVIRVPAGMIISISLVRRVTSCSRRPWAVTDKLISSVDVKLRVPSQRGLEVAHRFPKKRKSELSSKTYTRLSPFHFVPFPTLSARAAWAKAVPVPTSPKDQEARVSTPVPQCRV